MAPVSERVPVLMSAAEKKRISKEAQRAGVSIGEYLRRAAAAFSPDDENEALDGLLRQVEKSTAAANAAMERTLARVDASNRRIEIMETAARRTRP